MISRPPERLHYVVMPSPIGLFSSHCQQQRRLFISLATNHDGPSHSGDFIGNSNGGDLCRSAAHDASEPEPLGAVLSSMAYRGMEAHPPLDGGAGMGPGCNPLLTDLYQLNMIEAYLAQGETNTAIFELFVREFPRRRGFLIAAGLEQALKFLENLRFTADEIDWLKSTGRFSARTLDYLAELRFTGEVHAMPEGTVFFPNEPILRITAPLPEAQLVEARLINIVHFQSLIASKAARIVLAAPDKLLVDFGLRRAHGAEAGLMAARASYIAGFAGTATVLADKRFGIPIFGTMAHSYVQIHNDEAQAFENFARARPKNLILLIDTYDTEAAARKVVALAPRLRAAGISIGGVRLDSGDLITLSKTVRRI